MRQNIKALLLSTVFVAAGSLAANAGGLVEPFGGLKDGGYGAPAPILQPMGGSLKDAPMAPAQTGWYIRGDLGYSSYANVGGYIGEHQQFIGSNMIGTDGNMVGDFDGSCQINGNGDYIYQDRGFVYNDAGERLYSDGNYYVDDAAAQAADANNFATTNYTNADGTAVAADGYFYFTDPSTGKPVMRFNPQARTDASNAGIPVLDGSGNPTLYPVGTDPATIANPVWIDDGTGTGNGQWADSVASDGNVNGSSAGLWEIYNPGAEQWSNIAAVYHDNSGNQKVLIWDKSALAWGDRADTTVFGTQDIINAVRELAVTIPAHFIRDASKDLGAGRERDWLNMAAAAAGRSTCNVGRQALSSADIDDTWTIGGGVGYYFNSHWRGDLTFDYRANSDVTAKHDFLDQYGTSAITATHTAELSSFVALANLYYDFGDRSGFSPYIGAGIGFSVNRMGDRNITCWNNTANASCGADATGSGDSNTDVAAAAMVGFTKALGSNLKLDVGYRYLYMGDAMSGNEMAAADAGSQGQLVLEDLTAHEIRVGLRYDFGCGACR